MFKPHAVDHVGSSALLYASMCGAVHIIQELLDKSASLPLCNHEGYKRLTLALKNYSIARQKVKKGIAQQSITCWIWMPIH